MHVSGLNANDMFMLGNWNYSYGFRYPYLKSQSWWLNAYLLLYLFIYVIAFVGGLYIFHTWLACTCMTT